MRDTDRESAETAKAGFGQRRQGALFEKGSGNFRRSPSDPFAENPKPGEAPPHVPALSIPPTQENGIKVADREERTALRVYRQASIFAAAVAQNSNFHDFLLLNETLLSVPFISRLKFAWCIRITLRPMTAASATSAQWMEPAVQAGYKALRQTDR